MRTASIPITDHDTGSPMICTNYYTVEYKPTGTSGWFTVSPNPIESPVLIEGLMDDISYDLRVTRMCCNGAISTPTITTFTTTP